MLHRVLLIDASSTERDALEIALDPARWSSATVSDASAALAALDREDFDVVICDDAIPGLDGFELVPQLLRKQPRLRVLLAASSDREDRFESAARLGAAGLIERPLRADEIHFVLRQGERDVAEHRRVAFIEQDLARVVGDKPIVGASEPMIDLLEAMENMAGFKTPTVLKGEPGTHREVLARAIHAQSARRSAPFMAMRCTESTPDTAERSLFGGSPTGDAKTARAGRLAQADGGTAYLDDVASLSHSVQERLLHLLETGELLAVDAQKARSVDVRVIVGATRPLEESVDSGRLLADLASRLCDAVLEVPPLRARSADVPLLVDHLVARFAADLGSDVRGVADSAMDRMLHYHWPGNVRELENVIERAVLLASTDRITLHELPTSLVAAVAESGSGASADFSLRRARRSFEADMIRRALSRTDGNRTRAAKLLEISHRALLYKIKEYGLRD